MTYMFEIINNDLSQYSTLNSDTTTAVSYCKFYQLRLRQLLTQNRYRKEHEVRTARDRQLKAYLTNHAQEQRLHQEYVNNIRQRMKNSPQEILPNKVDCQKRNHNYVPLHSSRTVELSIESSHASSFIEPRPKPMIKTKTSSLPARQRRIISAPILCEKPPSYSKVIPTINVEYADEFLSKSSDHSFTQAASSSSLNFQHRRHKHAHQTVLETIMFHLNTNKPSSISEGLTYKDIEHRFASSIAPTVYRSYERSLSQQN